MKAKKFLTPGDEKLVVDAIKRAELNTSGEIRVHIESKCACDVLERAVTVFNYLDMDETVEQNGVLIYLAVDSKKFAIIGDKGIDAKVPNNFWDVIKEEMAKAFSAGDFVGGLTNAIDSAGISLQKYFPYKINDVNEQPDEISFGN